MVILTDIVIAIWFTVFCIFALKFYNHGDLTFVLFLTKQTCFLTFGEQYFSTSAALQCFIIRLICDILHYFHTASISPNVMLRISVETTKNIGEI